MTGKTSLKAFGYIRVSSEEQANSGLSLSHQRSKITAYAKAMDIQLIEIIEDSGKSARNLNRPGIQKALEGIKISIANALIVLKLDRLTRSVKDLGGLVEFFDKTDAALISVQDSINTSTAGGRLVLNVLGSIAQWEREEVGERTAAALAVKKERGEKTGGLAPFGYDVTREGKLTENEKEQAAIKIIRSLYRRKSSLRAIGAKLEELGYEPKTGGKWHPQVIKQILSRNEGHKPGPR